MIKSTGIIRRLDELGRITLPIELRRNLDITDRDSVEIYVEDDRIILEKHKPTDIFTGEGGSGLIEFCGKRVSLETVRELASLAGLLPDEEEAELDESDTGAE